MLAPLFPIRVLCAVAVLLGSACQRPLVPGPARYQASPPNDISDSLVRQLPVGPTLSAQELEALDREFLSQVATPYDRPPALLSGRAPIYPMEALQNRVTGVASIEFVVDEAGAVREARVTNDCDPLLARAALDSVRSYRFQPFMRSGVVVPAAFTRRIIYVLEQQSPLPGLGGS
jgi:TonB family protein